MPTTTKDSSLRAEVSRDANTKSSTKVVDDIFAQMGGAVRTRTRAKPTRSRPQPLVDVNDEGTGDELSWMVRGGKFFFFCISLFGVFIFLWTGFNSWITSGTASNSVAVTPASGHSNRRSVRIDEVKLGYRMAGTNPLRDHVDAIDPDPETWRQISLHMHKESGNSLWIELLRPLEWIEETEAQAGKTIFLDLPEMGAVGEADVTMIGPCPPIKPGKGNVVTGTFKHEADERSGLVRLRVEGQEESTGVTANHPYWSEDRQEYVPVGELREGELVNTDSGARRVESITPDPDFRGFLYNLETTEHVYRVGSLGTLVHNSCVIHGTPQFTSASHAAEMQKMAKKMASSGAYTDVFMHSRWSTILKGKGVSVAPNNLPDIAGIRLDGKIDLIEIASSQRDFLRGNLLGRNQHIWHQLPPNLRGDIIVIDHLGNWSHVFP